VNSVVSLISSVARVSEENEKGYLVKSSLDSRFVASIGASLEEFAEDVRAILSYHYSFLHLASNQIKSSK
jgi:hypothetical protein